MALLGPLTYDDALALVRTLVPADDLNALLARPGGVRLLQAVLEPLCELSAKLDRQASAQHILRRPSDVAEPATGARKVKVRLELSTSGPDVVVPTGAVVITAELHRYRLVRQVALSAAAGSVEVEAESMVAASAPTIGPRRIVAFEAYAVGSQGDRDSLVPSAADPTLVRLEQTSGDRLGPAVVGMYVEFLDGLNEGRLARIERVESGGQAWLRGQLQAESRTCGWVLRQWAQLGVRIAQPLPSTLGRDDELDQIARELGRPRLPGESDSALGRALLKLADVVDPLSVGRVANRAAHPHGPVWVYEPSTTVADILDPEGNVRPWPGFVLGVTGLGVGSSRHGLCALGASHRVVLLDWCPRGLGQQGGYLGVVSPAPEAGTASAKRAFALGRSPLGTPARGDGRLRARVHREVQRVVAGGTAVRWLPR